MKIEDNKMNMVNYSSQSHHNHLQRYALFHGLGLALDLLLLLVVGLCTLHFLDFDLPTAFFARFFISKHEGQCCYHQRNLYFRPALEDASAVCHLPNQGLLQVRALINNLGSCVIITALHLDHHHHQCHLTKRWSRSKLTIRPFVVLKCKI